MQMYVLCAECYQTGLRHPHTLQDFDENLLWKQSPITWKGCGFFIQWVTTQVLETLDEKFVWVFTTPPSSGSFCSTHEVTHIPTSRLWNSTISWTLHPHPHHPIFHPRKQYVIISQRTVIGTPLAFTNPKQNYCFHKYCWRAYFSTFFFFFLHLCSLYLIWNFKAALCSGILNRKSLASCEFLINFPIYCIINMANLKGASVIQGSRNLQMTLTFHFS